MRSETAHPCIAPERSARRISRSSVPWRRSSRDESGAIDVGCRQHMLFDVECQQQSKLARFPAHWPCTSNRAARWICASANLLRLGFAPWRESVRGFTPAVSLLRASSPRQSRRGRVILHDSHKALCSSDLRAVDTEHWERRRELSCVLRIITILSFPLCTSGAGTRSCQRQERLRWKLPRS